jgi:tRNA threonylcarbamoyl adenosine modification protein (Sua5/YciO/YrdC/YwlC family)
VNPEILKINAHEPEPSLISYAAERIRRGQVVGMPTDTFYGLAADPFNLHAVDRIYDIKSRNRHKPLSLLIEGVEQAEHLAKPLPDEFYLLAEKFWPGPLTIVVPASPKLPLKVTANTGNIAVRVPAAEIPVAVIRAAGLPLTATSANLHGMPECTDAEGVRIQFNDRLPIIVDGGPCPISILSTIVQLSDSGRRWRLMREGAIPVQQIEEILGDQ